jgi:hypothetical protein
MYTLIVTETSKVKYTEKMKQFKPQHVKHTKVDREVYYCNMLYTVFLVMSIS